eukprot:TRINITY_DN63170_c0_g1_i1.p1 TRINITY_DN63170_c0_g1~~TRINITY_DN63170_c0_g1_i1.p1  ORF type:complete len:160 (+),score=16.55 TRINITY_DN63170_c0_g1_i1:38-517(+)
MVRKGFGYRCRTRELYAKKFGNRDLPGISTYLQVYKRGQFVDVVANPSIQKGLPYKYYHGKTGQVVNITPRGLTVRITKRVTNRILKKLICIRFEHARPSRCQEEFKARVKANEQLKKDGKKRLKRFPALPKPAQFVKSTRRVKSTGPSKYSFYEHYKI